MRGAHREVRSAKRSKLTRHMRDLSANSPVIPALGAGIHALGLERETEGREIGVRAGFSEDAILAGVARAAHLLTMVS